MGEIVNLNKARKARTRQDSRAQAERNRVLHGRTKAERVEQATSVARVDRDLDGKRLD